MTERVVDVDGDVVRRPRKRWTQTVHALLCHLYAEGLPVPEPLAVDERYEYVRLVPGDGGEDAWPHQTTTTAVASAGALVRAVHDATRSWTPPAWAEWAVPSEGTSVICHGDPQPRNMASRDGRAVGLFDWDVARPAEPVGDVAYALEWLTPFDDDVDGLRLRGLSPSVNRRARIEAFLEGYQWQGPLDVVDAVLTRQQRAIDEVVWLGRAGHEPQASWVAAGWPVRWAAKLAVTERIRPDAT
jgi:aminoglycoside phosphotransferase (APT) family kinase protein